MFFNAYSQLLTDKVVIIIRKVMRIPMLLVFLQLDLIYES